eukprot:SAG11_NODE_3732_length_2258_cov_1.641501_1_plen_57_part_00
MRKEEERREGKDTMRKKGKAKRFGKHGSLKGKRQTNERHKTKGREGERMDIGSQLH